MSDAQLLHLLIRFCAGFAAGVTLTVVVRGIVRVCDWWKWQRFKSEMRNRKHPPT